MGNYGFLKNSMDLSNFKKVIARSKELGIYKIDTAFKYNLNEVFLDLIKENFKIYTKIQLNKMSIKEIKTTVDKFIFNSNVDKIEGLYIHDPENLNKKEYIDKYFYLFDLKEKGKINKIGISLNDKSEYELVSELKLPDIFQIPYNVFDNRFEKIINYLIHNDKEIFIRSVFLQGVALSSGKNIKNKLFSNHLKKWIKYNNNNVLNCLKNSIINIAYLNLKNKKKLNYVLGFNNYLHFQNFIEILNDEIYEIPSFTINDEYFINPTKW